MAAVLIVFVLLGVWVSSGSTPREQDTLLAQDEAFPLEDVNPETQNYIGPAAMEGLAEGAQAGDAEAQFALAMALAGRYERTGDVALQVESQQWLEASATQNHARAQNELGNRHVTGRGVVQDFAQAADWYRKAAEQGDAEAMYGLGELMESGWGVDESLVEAYVWLNLASARGEKRANEARRQVLGRLSKEQLNEAQRRSRELDERIPRPDFASDLRASQTTAGNPSYR